jgi:hypothetical protein
VIFRLFDRDCCDLTEISGIPGGSLTFGCRMDLDHFLAWRAGTNSRYSMGDSPPIKAGRQELIPHLETTCSRFITSTRRRTCSSAGPGRSQQLEIPPSLNSKRAACFSSSATISTDAGISPGAVFQRPQGFYHPPDFHWPQGFYHKIRLIFTGRKDFTIRLIFTGRKDFTIRLIFTGRKHLYVFFSAYIFDYLFTFLLSVRQYSKLAQLFQAFRFKIVYCSNDYY